MDDSFGVMKLCDTYMFVAYTFRLGCITRRVFYVSKSVCVYVFMHDVVGVMKWCSSYLFVAYVVRLVYTQCVLFVKKFEWNWYFSFNLIYSEILFIGKGIEVERVMAFLRMN